MKLTNFLLGSLFAFATGGCLAAAVTSTHTRVGDWLAVIALLLAAASEFQTAFRR